MSNSILHMTQLPAVAEEDIRVLQEKERTYGGSWKKRGGVGAFMMLARKWDRIENIAEAAGYDIFEVIRGQGLGGADGELLAEIRDLRRYLMLVEAEMIVRMSTTLTAFGGGGSGGYRGAHRDTELEQARAHDMIREQQARMPDPTGMQNPFGYVEDEET